MFIKDLAKSNYFIAADNTHLCELLHPSHGDLNLPYSIAHAILKPGERSLPHRLKTSSEVYFLLEGEGEMHVNDEQVHVGPGQMILIPPGFWQHICNTGTIDLKFLCIVHPMWRADDEEMNYGGLRSR
ncbi:MAG: Cupin domain protein [Methanosaeta sp. PtaB.Bin018]|jgi:mannose-6-phosphate isomerase-like protein (cupin superfamily)|nr:cupin domain-containing protein [Methanothrix sp.]OPX75711.1 MAG: Cupin domain protein [Methanosaeta sp. PtaB.Bin018]OPY46112.1 MAG: Cupin domain protein [Methanosaeta sp. PtaU1.Bin016]